jgi:uncharacterized protein (TIGR02466 family)
MNFDLYFPTPIWWEDTNFNTEDMLKLCYAIKEQDPSGRKLSNDGGWQSNDFRPGKYPELKILEDKILSQAEQCVRDFGFDEKSCFPVLENIWFNVNFKHNSNMVHMHDASFVSGVFYLKARPGQGKITMYKNMMQDFATMSFANLEKFTPISASAISYDPITGRKLNIQDGVSTTETEI